MNYFNVQISDSILVKNVKYYCVLTYLFLGQSTIEYYCTLNKYEREYTVPGIAQQTKLRILSTSIYVGPRYMCRMIPSTF